VAVSAAFAIVAAHRGDRQGVYLFKPLTTLIILVGAAFLIRPAPPLYRALIVVGLGCSLGGDILLMLPGERLIAGIVAFLLAHLAYVAAFSLANPVTARQLVWLLPFLVFSAVVLADRWRTFGRLKVPLVVYAIVISTMAWRAAMRSQAVVIPRQTFLFGALGAGLFVVSDALVVLRRFGRALPGGQSLELAAYWAAQCLIALSLRGTMT
jgi:uncharacterized membrane protein YhhN